MVLFDVIHKDKRDDLLAYLKNKKEGGELTLTSKSA